MKDISKIKEFIRLNIKIIFSQENTTKHIKELKKRYFLHQLNKKFGIPREREIAKEAVLFLIKTKKPKDLDELISEIKKVPFLDEHIKEYESFKYDLEMPKEYIIDDEDISKHATEDFRHKLVEKFKEDARPEINEFKKRELKVIEDQKKDIQKTKDEVNAIKKALASLKIDEEEITVEIGRFEEVEAEKAFNIWWNRLGFIANPFPGDNKGLIPAVESRFSNQEDVGEDERRAFFSDVLISNNIFKEFETKINEYQSDFFNNTYVIIGGFGSGKSVLFEFIQKETLKNNILPIIIRLDSKKDIETISRDFYKGILTSKVLKSKYSELFHIDIRTVIMDYDCTDVCDHVEQVVSTGKFNGVLFIIDGLHKNRDLYKEALKFIISLQNFSERIGDCGIKSSIIIAGDLIWMNDIKQDTALSGTINTSNVKILPCVETVTAHQMFNKRFKAFSSDKENHTKIRKEQVDTITKRLKARFSRPLSFRDYIDEIIPSLKEGHTENILINPLYSTESINKIFSHLEYKYPDILRKLNVVKSYFSKKPENAIKLIDVLITVSKSNFLSKESSEYKEKNSLLGILLNIGLLKEAIQRNNNVGLTISPEIQRFNAEIRKEFGYSFNEVISAIMRKKILKLEDSESHVSFHEEVMRLKTILIQNPGWKSKLERMFNEAIDLHTSILTSEDNQFNFEILGRTKNSIKTMLNIIFLTINSSYKQSSLFEELDDKIRGPYMWLLGDTELYSLFSSKVKRLSAENKKYERTEYYELFSNYKYAFMYLTDLIDELIRTHNTLSIDRIYLSLNDMKNVHQMRKTFTNNKFEDCTSRLQKDFEEKMRSVLYTILKIKYGDNYRSRLGTIVNDHIKNNEQKNKKSLLYLQKNPNYLFLCDRTDYSLIILGEVGSQNNKKENWDQIFKFVFENMQNKLKIETYFNLIHPFITGSAHNWNKLVWEKNSDKLRDAVKNFTDLCEWLNKAYLLILDKKNIYISGNKEFIFFSFYSDMADKTHLKPLAICNEQFSKIADEIDKKINQNKYLVVDLEDYGDIEYEYHCDYRDFIGVLATLIKWDKIELIFSEGCFRLIKK